METLVDSDLSVYNVETMGDNEIRIRATLGKWGNSAAVRLPATLLAQANFSSQQPIDLVLSKGRIILDPVRESEPSLSDLVAQITPANLHGEIDSGSPQGREAL